MSVLCISRVLDLSVHAGTELLALVVLADYSDDNGNSYPSVAALARKCRMSTRNTNYILGALQASGELRVLRNQGPRGTNRYRIMLDALGKSSLKPASPLKRSAPPAEACTPEAPFTLKPASGTPEAGFPKPLKPASDEPSLNRQEPSTLVRSSRSKRDRGQREHEFFAEFYSAYPRKVARKAAAQAFAKVNPTRELLAVMLTAIETQGLARHEERFVPHPATWLNGGRWTDGSTDGATGAAPVWLTGTGFGTVYEAETAGCGPGNAAQFRDRKKVMA